MQLPFQWGEHGMVSLGVQLVRSTNIGEVESSFLRGLMCVAELHWFSVRGLCRGKQSPNSEQIKLSIWIDSSVNSFSYSPSSWHARSAWRYRFNHFLKSNLRVSSTQSVCAANVWNDKAYSTAVLLPWHRASSWSPALLPPSGWSKTSLSVEEVGKAFPSTWQWPNLLPFRLAENSQTRFCKNLWVTRWVVDLQTGCIVAGIPCI